MKFVKILYILILSVLLFAPPTMAAINDYNASLNAMLHFNETQPNLTLFYDSSKNNISVSSGGNARYSNTTKKFGNASVYLDASNTQYVYMPDSIAWTLPNGVSWTSMVWLNFTTLPAPSSGNGGRKAIWGTSGCTGDGSCWRTYIKKDASVPQINIGVYSSEWNFNCPNITTNTWTQLVVRRTGSNLEVFNDGIECGSDAGLSTLSSDWGDLLLGRTYGTYSYESYYDEFAFWNVSIPITDLYPQTTEVQMPAPVSSLSASFTQSISPSLTGQAVTFTDTSTGSPTTWNWTINGVVTNTTQNAAYTFTSPGTFNVNLSVTNSTGSVSNSNQTHTVTISYKSTFTPTMTSDTAPAGNYTYCSSYFSAGYECWRAFDHNNATSYWASSNTGFPKWITIKTSTPHVATNYTIWPREDIPLDTPKDFKLNASNDNINWVTLDTQTGIAWSAKTPRSFPFSNTVPYTYYNLTISADGDGGVTGVSEMYLYETDAYPYTYTNGTDTISIFNTPGTTDWTVPDGVTHVRLLVVAGAGNGGTGGGGGGGAGGVIAYNSYAVTPGQIWNVTVGTTHTNSSFNQSTTVGNVAMYGGNGGDNPTGEYGDPGGSGGGGSASGTAIQNGGTGINGQGKRGGSNDGYITSPYPSGGGGGNSTVGGNATSSASGNGGDGWYDDITGTTLPYGCGGGGGLYAAGTIGTGGCSYTGGNGSAGAMAATAGRNETGSGGGGAGYGGGYGGIGGTGIVILRYSGSGAAPVASFTASNTTGTYPPTLPVKFTDTSTGTPTSWEWNFTNTTGNNTAVTFATTQSPLWSFDIGNFSISLKATNAGGSDLSDQVTWINVSAPTTVPAANFTANGGYTPISGTAPFTVVFNYPQENGSTSWSWIFGDGNTTVNTDQNPSHLYKTAGTYSVNHSATNVIGIGWKNVSSMIVVSNASGFTPQDIWMVGQFTQTFHITDSSTGLPIPVVQLQDTAMQTYTTTNGTGYLTEAFGSSSVAFTSTGYSSKSISYVFDSDATWDVQLTKAPATSAPISQGTPIYVAIHFVEGFGTPVSGVSITAVPYTTSTGSFAYLAALLGIPLDQVPMENQTMNQTSGTDGKGAFYVLPTTQYNFTFDKTGYTFTPPYMFTSFKNNQDIYISAKSSGSSGYFPNGGEDVNSAINYSVSVIRINDTASFLNMSYNDSTATTTGGTIRVIQQNNTPYQQNITVASWPIVGSSCSNSTVITHPQEVNGEAYLSATSSKFGVITKSDPFSMKGQAVKFMGFGPEIALLFALFIMMMTVMLGTAQTARQVTFGGLAFEMWVFYAIGWFDSLVARGVPEVMLLLGMTIVTIVAIFAIFELRKKKEKY